MIIPQCCCGTQYRNAAWWVPHSWNGRYIGTGYYSWLPHNQNHTCTCWGLCTGLEHNLARTQARIFHQACNSKKIII